MKTLANFLTVLSDELISTKVCNENHPISIVTIDSRQTITNTCFVAINGLVTNGHQYIAKAIELGATTIVHDQDLEIFEPHVNYIQVKDSRKAASMVAADFYDYPSKKMKVVGVTGTNGKTSCVSMLYSVCKKMGLNVAKFTTIENEINGKVVAATHTTPGPIELQQLLAECVKSGCEYCFMEVSSHAVDQERVAAVQFEGGVFTNLTHDHLDYHLTFKDYLNAKKKFFDNLSTSAFALTNIDDKNGEVMVQNCKASIKTYALRKVAHFKTKIIDQSYQGLHLRMNNQEVIIPLVGDFNAYNLTVVFGVASLLGLKHDEVLVAMSTLQAPPGRFELVSANGILGIVDYAHTPDALENVLKTIQRFNRTKGKIITVVGCGGNRDKTKRPKMAQIAVHFSDKTIITSDNPRNEKPTSIIAEMVAGLDNQQIEKTIQLENRKEAIRLAVLLANKGDLILVAGKGHEKYQEIEGVKHPFDDKEILFFEIDKKTGF